MSLSGHANVSALRAETCQDSPVVSTIETTGEMIASCSDRVDRPRAGVRRWLTDDERTTLPEPKAARLSLMRAIGEDSPARDHVTMWLDTIDSDNTRAAYAADVRRFVEWLRDRHGVDADDAPVNLLAVDRRVIATYTNDMRDEIGRYGKPLSAKTRARRLASLSSLYQHLLENDVIETNPAAGLRRPRYSKDGVTPVRPADEIARMIEAADANPRDLVLVLLLFVSALRVSEVGRVRVEDIAWDNGRCVLQVPTKGNEHRLVPLNAAVCQAIELYLSGRETGPLLLDDRGGPLKRHHVRPILTRLAKRAGLPQPERISPHVMRASAATAWLEAGKPLQRVQPKLGHKHSTTTEVYYRRTLGLDQDAALAAELVAELPIAAVLDRMRASRAAAVSA
jgi:site-specific recombinase XerD